MKIREAVNEYQKSNPPHSSILCSYITWVTQATSVNRTYPKLYTIRSLCKFSKLYKRK